MRVDLTEASGGLRASLGAGIFLACSLGSASAQTPASNPSTTDSPAIMTLPPVDVGGRAESPTGPGVGYVATTSRTATKTDTPILETPQSISTVTRAQMDAQNARSVNEALRYTSGVAAEQRGGTSRYDQLTIRGFNSSTAGPDQYLDGLKLLNGTYYATQQIDPFLLERIEVLKGPASVLYGQGNPGGILALSSKLPVDERIRDVQIEGGSLGYIRGTVDFGGRLNEDGTLLYRFAGTAFSSGAQDRHTTMERIAIAPAITWQPTGDTTLTITGRYQHDPQAGSYEPVPAIGSVLFNPLGMLNMDFYAGDTAYERYNRTQAAIGYMLEHRFNDNWKFRSAGRYTNVGSLYNAVYGTSLDPDFRTLNRATAASEEHFDTVTLDNSVLGKFNTGPLAHELLIGIGWQNLRDDFDYASGAAPTLDIFAPVYGQAIPHPVPFFGSGVTSQDLGIYVQDQVSIGGFRLMVGGRYDWASIDTRNHFSPADSFDQSDRAFTFRAGLLYLFDNGIAPYFTYAQSFQPLNQLSATGSPFKPTRGELFEVGVKYQPTGFNSFMSVALYNLTQDNVLTSDPDHFGFSVQAGQIRSRGIELEAHASLTDQINLVAAYTYQDVTYTKDLSGRTGKRPTEIPNQFASVWGEWTAPEGSFAGLGGGLGVRFVGTTNGDLTVPLITQPYTLVDAQIHYDLGRAIPSLEGARLQVTAQNLLDERYVATCYSYEFGCTFGVGRSVIARLAYQW
ncbi:MAG: TonB-dependent siderophore receptor [Alphaproteobacteria bacterium]|nr:TonB-dependent siderophore receptor [Alphaproteobacteria bacterium]